MRVSEKTKDLLFLEHFERWKFLLNLVFVILVRRLKKIVLRKPKMI